MNDMKTEIVELIKQFASIEPEKAAIELFEKLGYNTNRKSPFSQKNFAAFKAAYLKNKKEFKVEKAQVDKWKTVNMLFQLTKAEITNQTVKVIDNKGGDKRSYLFFIIELEGEEWKRANIARITREVNKVFPIPVFIVFKHGDYISLSIIGRRKNIKDKQKYVLEKVKMIKDISINNPHRAHLEIILDLSYPKLSGKHKIKDFDDLHNAWSKTLDITELNEKFYREIYQWYEWAIKQVRFPEPESEVNSDSIGLDADKNSKQNLIRLLTRLLFVWFMKERKLIPNEFFDPEYIKEALLKEFHPNNSTSVKNREVIGSYYCAILQNLFFASLNQPMTKRKFRKNRKNKDIKQYMRYENYFKKPLLFRDKVEECVPFMNGGLFECLDTIHQTKKGRQGGDISIYVDGFSDKCESLLIPDYIFFDGASVTDSEKSNKKKIGVRGIINILNDYKFTIIENTPVEEDIALDPELLGRMFEELLATTVESGANNTERKSSGSYYTPRSIVDFMVDKSIYEYLYDKIKTEQSAVDKKLADNLRKLISYEHPDDSLIFQKSQNDNLIKALDDYKMFDPACGSGAFPMGALNKMVHILSRLDPNNILWKERQINKAREIEDSAIRDNAIQDINKAFEANELDYGRKLYLIENCIFGVDIQVIAIQICKLRFFISLIVDQKIDKENDDNFDIRPLPNLETKFVAADALVEIERRHHGESTQLLLEAKVVRDKISELNAVRREMFTAKHPTEKRSLREKDEKIRNELARIYEEKGWQHEIAEKLAQWDPYNQNVSSTWFDPEWMFGISGFDTIIGNPPYVRLEKNKNNNSSLGTKYKNCNYQTFRSRGDIYCLFYERGCQLLKPSGHLCFITSNKWLRADYGKELRNYFLDNTQIKILIDIGPNAFKATVDTNILLLSRQPNNKPIKAATLNEMKQINLNDIEFIDLAVPQKGSIWVITNSMERKIKEKIDKYGIPLGDLDISINYGIKTGFNDAFIVDQKTRDELIKKDPKSAEILKPILRGRDIDRYKINWNGLWVIIAKYDSHNSLITGYPEIYKHLKQYETKLKIRGQCRYSRSVKKNDDKNIPGQHHWLELDNNPSDRYINLFSKEKIIYPNMTKYIPFYLDCDQYFTNQKCFIITGKNLKYLVALLNSKTVKLWIRNNCPELQGGTKELSKMYIRNLPIPKISEKKQPHFVNRVNKVIEKKKRGECTLKIESEINRLTYKLYKLTPQEIDYIEKISIEKER